MVNSTNSSNKGCSVFVGNIDFEVGETEVIDRLKEVGNVVNFRMVYDKATGKSKGYGFCEYETPEIAKLARNTLDIVFNKRQVKINYAENDMPQQKSKEEVETSKVSSIDTIIKVIDEMSDFNGIKEILLYLKSMAINQPSDLIQLLKDNPNLCCAVMFSLIKFNIVEEKKILDIFTSSLNIDIHKNQIMDRINNMSLKGLSLESINRIEKIRDLLSENLSESE